MQHLSNGGLPGLFSRPRSLLGVHRLLQNRRYSSDMIDYWRYPIHQAKALGIGLVFADSYVCFIGRPYVYSYMLVFVYGL